MTFDDGERVKVQRTNLHRCDCGDSPRPTVPARKTSWTVPVGELQAWLQQYEHDNNVDLVLNSVNGRRSRQLFDQLVAELAAAQQAPAAGATEGEAADDDEHAAAAALALCQQQEQQHKEQQQQQQQQQQPP